MDEQRLKKSYVAYILAAILFTVTLSVTVVVHRYCSEMKDTVDKLRTLSGNSVRVKRATQSAHDTVVKIKNEIPATYLSSPVENNVYQAIDTVRERAKNAEIAVETLQERDGGVELPVVVKGSLDDYADFLRLLHFLESLRFPFFSTSELIMTREADKPPSYELRGLIKTLKPSEAGDNGPQSTQRRRG